MLKKLSSKVQIGFFLLFVIIFLGVEYHRLADLNIYLTAATDLFNKESIYTNLYGKKLFFYLGNPFLTILFYPLTFLPFTLVALLFKLSSIGLLFRIHTLLLKYFPTQHISSQKLTLFQGLVFVSCFFLIYSNLHMVQLTIFLLYLSLEGLYQISDKQRSFFGAFLISLAIGIKLSPIVLIPYLFYRNHLKEAFFVVALCGVYFYLPSLILGIEKAQQLWTDWWALVEPISKEQIFDTNNRKNHGISTLLSTLFLKDLTDNVVHLTNRRYLIGLSETTVQWLIFSVRIFLACFTLYFLRSKPFQKQIHPLSKLWEVSYLFLIIPLFFPQQRIYNFIFLFPSITYLLYHFLFEKETIHQIRWKRALFTLAVVALNLELLLGQFRKFYWHYKTITYATLIVLVLLVIIRPKNNKLKEV